MLPLLAAMSLFGVCSCSRQRPTIPLPDLPRLTTKGLPPAVREAMQKADDAARAQPKGADANGRLGMVLHAHQRFGAAEVCYRRALILDPRSFRWAYYLGVVQAEQGNNAEASLRQALQIDPSNLPAQLRLAEALWSSRNLAESGQVYEGILRVHPDQPLACYGLGRVRAAQGRWADAVTSYRKACELYPPFGSAHHALSQAYRRLGKMEESKRHLVLYEVNKSGEPVRDDPLLTEVLTLNRSRTYYVKRAFEFAQAGLLRDAVGAYERSIELDPRHPLVAVIHAKLVGLYADLGQWDKVEAHYREVLRLNPRQAEAHFYYGVAAVRQGDKEKAERSFQRALEIDPRHAWARNQIGRLLEQKGQRKEAERHYRQAIASDPQHRMALFNVGRLLVERQKYNDAIPYLLKTLTPEDVNTPRYTHYLATVYEKAGKREKAIEFARVAKEKAATLGQREMVEKMEGYLRRMGEAADKLPTESK